MRARIKSHADNVNYNRDVELTLYQDTMAGNGEPTRSVGILTFAAIEDGQVMPDPTVKLFRDDAQELMDALWSVGLRPTEGSGSAGSLAATERHLEDMRKLVFDQRAAAIKVPL